jgi:hypothetical protein
MQIQNIFKKKETCSVERLLRDIDELSGSEGVKKVLQRFIEDHMALTEGIILIYTHGKSVDIDGTRFTDPEAVWALNKALNQILNKGLSLND